MKFSALLNIRSEETLALLSHLQNSGIEPYKNYLKKYNHQDEVRKLLASLPPEFYNHIKLAPHKETGQKNFKFIDLFAGIGGFRLALNTHGGHCVFSSEWDNSAKETYFRNYGEIPFGDITQFTSDKLSDSDLNTLIPDHDVLAAGFPCQPFSKAGVSARNALKQPHGFNCKSQGTLFYDVARITSVKKPKALFLENVRNLKTHDEGKTFKIIEETICELGYHFSHAVINAESVVPQKRVRCYMIAIRNDYPKFSFDLSPFKNDPIPLKSILEKGRHTLDYQISEKLWIGHKNRTARNIKRGTGFVTLEANVDKPANTLVARYGKDGKECLIPLKVGPPRKLTKREAARLQGYPETFLLPESKTPTYKQMGNSVSVPVVTEIGSQIINHLKKNDGI